MYQGQFETADNRFAQERERLMLWTETSQDIEGDDPFMIAFDPHSFMGYVARFFGLNAAAR